MKKTVVIGASDNNTRYSNIAARRLKEYGHPLVAVGLKDGMIGDIPMTKELKDRKSVV